MAKRINSVRASKTVASKASKLMQDSRSSDVRRVAASTLSNRKKTNK